MKKAYLFLLPVLAGLILLASSAVFADEPGEPESIYIEYIEQLALIGGWDGGVTEDPPLPESYPLDGNYILVRDLDFCDEAMGSSYLDPTESPGIDDFCKENILEPAELDPLAPDPVGWTPIGDEANPFTGTFSVAQNGGEFFTISNLYIDSPNDFIGLFGITQDATLENIILEDVDITGQNNVGGLVGGMEGGTVTNCHSSGEVKGMGPAGKTNIGGLIGAYISLEGPFSLENGEPSKILNSSSSCNVEGVAAIGGLVGETGQGTTIKNSNATGNVTASDGEGVGPVGGLVGYNESEILNSYAEVDVDIVTPEGDAEYIGGLVGWNEEGDILNSSATGNIEIDSMVAYAVGGLVGYNTGRNGALTEGTYATGNIEINASDIKNIGGLIGWNNNQIEDSYAEGNVTIDLEVLAFEAVIDEITGHPLREETLNIGGLVGMNLSSGALKNVYAEGDVTITILGDFIPYVNSIGGLTGWTDGPIETAYATGNVYAPTAYNVGGLAGGAEGTTIKETYATGDVEGDEYVGGLVGMNISGMLDSVELEEEFSIELSYATGNVEGSSYVGGLVGENFGGKILYTYARGTTTGDEYVGGLVGTHYGTGSLVSYSFSTGSVVSAGGYVGGLIGTNLTGEIVAEAPDDGERDGKFFLG